MSKDIYSRIYGNNNSNNQKNNEILDDEKVNNLIPSIVAFTGFIVSIFCLITLLLCYSFDLCVFLDNYYVYIAGVSGIFLLIGVYFSFKSLKQKFNLLSILNLLLSVITIVVFIIPFLFGLLYLNF